MRRATRIYFTAALLGVSAGVIAATLTVATIGHAVIRRAQGYEAMRLQLMAQTIAEVDEFRGMRDGFCRDWYGWHLVNGWQHHQAQRGQRTIWRCQ